MIDVVASWGAPIAVLLAAAIGAGDLVGRAAGRRIAASLLLPVGLAALVIVGAWAAWLAVPALALSVMLGLLAAFGVVVGWRRRRVARAGVAAVVGVMALYAWPFLASGQPTIGAYTVLADPVIHLVGADGLLGGASASARQPGAFRAFYDGYFGQGYPTGGAALLGALAHAVSADPVHVLTPLLLVALASLTAALWHLATPLVPSAWWRAFVAALPASSALMITFTTNGSQKEILAITLLAATAAALRTLLEQDPLRPRNVLIACVPAGGALSAIGLAAGIYLAPMALLIAVPLLRRPGRSVAVLAAAAVGTVALALPVLAAARAYVEVSGASLTSSVELGNLVTPLPWSLVIGPWVGPDVRVPSAHPSVTQIAAVFVGGWALLGWAMIARRLPRGGVVAIAAWGAAILVGTLLAVRAGSPWADAKALTIASPAVLFGAGVGIAAAITAGRAWVRRAAFVAGGVAAAGMALTVLPLLYSVAPVPDARYRELAAIDHRFAGRGMMGVVEFEEYARHVLRDVPIRLVHDPYARLQATGTFGISADPDDLQPAEVGTLRLLLVRRGPQTSRPPSEFELAWRGRWYEVWRRSERPAPRARLALGAWTTGGLASPTCDEVRRFAAQAQPGEQLVAATRPAVAVGATASAPRPAKWGVDTLDATVVKPRGGGRLEVPLDLGPAAAGREVELWWDVSTLRSVDVRAGAARATVPPMTLNQRHVATRVLRARADERGRLVVALTPAGERLRPAWSDFVSRWGQLFAVVHGAPGAALIRVAPGEAGRLCGRSLDWLELVPATATSAAPRAQAK